MQTSWNVYCRTIEMLQNSQFVLKCCTFCTYFFMRPSNPGPTWGTWLTLVLINWSNFWASSSRALESTWWLTQSDQPFWHKIQNVYCRTIDVSRVTPSHLINTPPIKKEASPCPFILFSPKANCQFRQSQESTEVLPGIRTGIKINSLRKNMFWTLLIENV